MHIFKTTLTYDEARNCIVSDAAFEDKQPTSLHQRMKIYSKLNGGHRASSQQLLTMMSPFIVPKPDLSKYKTATNPEIVVMCLPPASFETRYQLGDEESTGHSDFFRNQIEAMSWHMTRLALQGLGAQVVLAENILPRDAMRSSFVSTKDIFVRDPGFVCSTQFVASDPEFFFHSSLQNIIRAGDKRELATFQEAEEGLSLAMCIDKHRKAVVAAFQSAGCSLTLQNVSAHVEGGDVIVDPYRGLIFFGSDEKNPYQKITTEDAAFINEISDLTGANTIPIYRNRGTESNPSERFHLDSFMMSLPKGEMLLDPRHTSKESCQKLEQIYGGDLIRVGDDNATHVPTHGGYKAPNYTTNLVSVGDTLYMPSCGQKLRRSLRGRGYVVVSSQEMGVPTGYMQISDSGPHCITQTLPAPAPRNG